MKALLLVDIQNDFLPGGALPVAEGHQIIPIVNRLTQHPFDVIVASKDWHPIDHGSFAINHSKQPGEVIILEGLEQILWPVHCVQETPGSKFGLGLDTSKIEKIFYKGTEKNIDSYSTFFDNAHRKSTGLGDYLKKKNVQEIYIAGLATDYCVKYSVLDAKHLGFNTYVIADACRGVNLKPNDSEKAVQEMIEAGAKIIHSYDITND